MANPRNGILLKRIKVDNDNLVEGTLISIIENSSNGKLKFKIKDYSQNENVYNNAHFSRVYTTDVSNIKYVNDELWMYVIPILDPRERKLFLEKENWTNTVLKLKKGDWVLVNFNLLDNNSGYPDKYECVIKNIGLVPEISGGNFFCLEIKNNEFYGTSPQAKDIQFGRKYNIDPKKGFIVPANFIDRKLNDQNPKEIFVIDQNDIDESTKNSSVIIFEENTGNSKIISNRVSGKQNSYERNKSGNIFNHINTNKKKDHDLLSDFVEMDRAIGGSRKQSKEPVSSVYSNINPSSIPLRNGISFESRSENKLECSPDSEYIKISEIPGTKIELLSVVSVNCNNSTLAGVVRWIGQNNENTPKILVGVELDEEPKSNISRTTDGVYNEIRYFKCSRNKAIFVTPEQCREDDRFLDTNEFENECLSNEIKYMNNHFGNIDCPVITGSVAPSNILSAKDFDKIRGRMKGIQGHNNSCYLDATLFAMFAFTSVFDSLLFRPANSEDIDEYEEVQTVLREEIVNPLRENHFVRADRVLKLRQLLDKLSSVRGLINEEKDPEEFLNSLLCQILRADPFLQLNSGQSAFFYQLFVEKDERLQFPSVQELFEQSFLSSNIKLKEIPSCLIIQMPRFGKNFKMYPRILPSQELDITDILQNSPRQCTICGKLAEYECKNCFGSFQSNCMLENTGFCSSCLDQTHRHNKRQNHNPQKLLIPEEAQNQPDDFIPPRVLMELFAVLCIETSHYVAFVKTGTGINAPWCFFDSMADRVGGENGFNIPEIIPVLDIPTWLSDRPNQIDEANEKKLPDFAKRLLGDAYMCMYQSTDVMMYR